LTRVRLVEHQSQHHHINSEDLSHFVKQVKPYSLDSETTITIEGLPWHQSLMMSILGVVVGGGGKQTPDLHFLTGVLPRLFFRPRPLKLNQN